MLCRTANELYWMARHIERAENTARLLDVTYRMSLLPYQVVEPGLAWAEPWSVPLVTNGLATAYYERYPELAAESVLRFMSLDPANPSSIFSCNVSVSPQLAFVSVWVTDGWSSGVFPRGCR